MIGWTHERNRLDACPFSCPFTIGLVCLCLCFLPLGTGGTTIVLFVAALLGLGRLGVGVALLCLAAGVFSNWLLGWASLVK
jgi:hypothetical protein